MKIIDPFGISPEMMTQMEAAVERAANGVRDPERVKEARARMDRIREEVRRKHGVLDIGLPAIHELRGQ